MFVNDKLQEFERYIYNKRVALIGLGISNLPLIDYFVDKGANVTVFDKRNIEEIDKDVLDKIIEIVSIKRLTIDDLVIERVKWKN